VHGYGVIFVLRTPGEHNDKQCPGIDLTFVDPILVNVFPRLFEFGVLRTLARVTFMNSTRATLAGGF